MTDAELHKMLVDFVQGQVPIQVFIGEVTEVDEENYTVDIKPPGQAELSEVRLKAAIDGEKTGLVEIPEVGSTVLFSIIGNQPDEATIIKCSKVAKIIINNGENGGLLIDEKANNNLKAIKDFIETMKSAISTGFQSVGAGSSANGATGKAAFESALSGQSISFEDMKNDKVTH